MHDNRYRHPHPGRFGRLLNRLANSARLANLRQGVMSRLPFLTLASEVRDVIYVSWLVDAEAAQALLPPGAPLWQRNGKTPLTVLTYRHGHFGPSLLGRLRRLLPSPLQSNWRLYLAHTPPGAPEVACVFFLKNVMDSLPHALGTRLFSDLLPTHLAAGMAHEVTPNEVTPTLARCSIAPGSGSAPALEVECHAGEPQLDADWQAVFGNWREAVAFLACQDAAVAHVPRNDRLAFGEISLPVDLTQVRALSPRLADYGLDDVLPPVSAPFAFLVPAVAFRALSEQLLPRAAPA